MDKITISVRLFSLFQRNTQLCVLSGTRLLPDLIGIVYLLKFRFVSGIT